MHGPRGNLRAGKMGGVCVGGVIEWAGAEEWAGKGAFEQVVD